MNALEQMNNADKNTTICPANEANCKRLPVRFAADFPVEFLVRRLEDVPLRVKPKETRLFQPAHQQP